MALKLGSAGSAVALYWDFENIHAALLDVRDGAGAYRASGFRPQEVIVEVEAVTRYVATIGDIAVNRAYGNWQYFGRYRSSLLSMAGDLVQMFPAGMHGKNGADIRLALDVLDDLHRLPHVTHVVVVASDSDYISLAQRCRAYGRTVIGIGVEDRVNPFWVEACSEFKYYRTLLGKTGAQAEAILGELKAESDPTIARRLLVTAMKQLLAQSSEDHVIKARLKPMMTRLDPTFDEGNFGFSSFTQFLAASSDLVVREDGKNDHLFRLTDAGHTFGQAPKESPGVATTGSSTTSAHSMHAWYPTEPPLTGIYADVLKRGNVRLVTPSFRAKAAAELFAVFKERNNEPVESFNILTEKLGERLKRAGVEFAPGDLSRMRHMCFRLRTFRLRPPNGPEGIALGDAAWSSGEQLDDILAAGLAKQVAQYADPPVDLAALACLIYGPNATARQRQVIAQAVAVPGEVSATA